MITATAMIAVSNHAGVTTYTMTITSHENREVPEWLAEEKGLV